MEDLRWIEPARDAACARAALRERLVVVERHGDPRAWLAALEPALLRRWPLDQVVWLDIPELLSDRLGPARAVLGRLLSGPGAASWLRALRGESPAGASPARWQALMPGLSEQGARRLEEALQSGSFGAAQALTARQDQEPELRNGEPGRISSLVLGEQDARALVHFLLTRPRGGVVHLWLTRAEELWLGESPHRRGFAQGLRAWIEVMARSSGLCALVTCWAAGVEGLASVDAALLGARLTPEGPWGGPMARAAPDPVALLRAVAEARGCGAPQPWFREDAWCAVSDDLDLLLIWPRAAHDPAAALVERVGALGDIRRGARIQLLAPAWAMGAQAAPSRHALAHAWPWLRWEPLDARDAWTLLWGQRRS